MWGGGGRSLRPPIFFLPFCISDRRRSCKSTLFSTPGQSSALRLPRRKIRMTPSFLQKLTLKKEINSNFLPPPPLPVKKESGVEEKHLPLSPHPSIQASSPLLLAFPWIKLSPRASSFLPLPPPIFFLLLLLHARKRRKTPPPGPPKLLSPSRTIRAGGER